MSSSCCGRSIGCCCVFKGWIKDIYSRKMRRFQMQISGCTLTDSSSNVCISWTMICILCEGMAETAAWTDGDVRAVLSWISSPSCLIVHSLKAARLRGQKKGKTFERKISKSCVFVDKGTSWDRLLGSHLTENEAGADSEEESTQKVSSGVGRHVLPCLGCIVIECINACDT